MKVNVVAVLKLSQMSPAEKITKGEFIGQQWELHGKDFPTTCPNTAEERTAATQRLSNAHAAALDGGRQARAEEQAASLEFDGLFAAYRDWANQPGVAQGDKVRINLLGLDVSRQEARRATDLPAPELLPLTGTTEGEITVSCPPMAGAKSYIIFMAYGDEMPAEDAYLYCMACTRPKMTVPARSGQRAWFKMLAVGVKGPSPLSAAVSRRVL